MIKVLENLNIIKESKTEKEIKVNVNDSEGELKELLDYIKDVSDAGHTFDVVVDPGNEDWEKSFEIDGDGAFSIKDIKEDDSNKDEKKEENLQPEQNIIKALQDMVDAMNVVTDMWHDKYDEVDDILSTKEYPFEKDFNEIVTDVAHWVEAAKSYYNN